MDLLSQNERKYILLLKVEGVTFLHNVGARGLALGISCPHRLPYGWMLNFRGLAS